ncbi:hypothetical protein V866_002396 [Kwoniella sp. B9012]
MRTSIRQISDSFVDQTADSSPHNHTRSTRPSHRIRLNTPPSASSPSSPPSSASAPSRRLSPPVQQPRRAAHYSTAPPSHPTPSSSHDLPHQSPLNFQDRETVK